MLYPCLPNSSSCSCHNATHSFANSCTPVYINISRHLYNSSIIILIPMLLLLLLQEEGGLCLDLRRSDDDLI